MLPKWFRRPSVGAVLWLTIAWFTVKNIEGFVAMPHPSAPYLLFIVFHCSLVLLITYSIVATADQTVATFQEKQAAVVRPAPRERAYLVVHLDLRVSPPVALFVSTYSCSAKDLTMVGNAEARADVYMVEADTFEEALSEMQRVAPLYFPWTVPLMTRKR